MEQKIRDYVNYQFRFDTRKNLDELKEEIIANLTDRYYENLKKTNDSNQAYIDAIKQMGDFFDKNEENSDKEFSVKPLWPDLVLLSGAILSIFAFILLLLGALIAGVIFTTMSILSYGCAAYYLYSYSQYVKKTEMNIEKHNLLLSKIFKYMKTSFAFWTISLSLIFSSIVYRVFVIVYGIDIENGGIENIRKLIILSALVFFIALVIFIILFYKLYKRLISRYTYLTGNTQLNGKISDSYKFIMGQSLQPKKNFWLSVFDSKYFLPVFSIIFLGISLISPIRFGLERFISGGYYSESVQAFLLVFLIENTFSENWFLTLAPLMFSVLTLIVVVFGKMNKRGEWMVIISFFLYHVSLILIHLLISFQFSEISAVGPFPIISFIAILFMIAVLLIRKLLRNQFQKQERERKKLKE